MRRARPTPFAPPAKAWLWPALAAGALACGPPPTPPSSPAPPEQTPVGEGERKHVTECARGIVARADVLRVAWSRYRGRPALAVSLSSPNDDLVDAYYGGGPGCDLVALVGGGPLDAEVQPGAPFRSLAEARRVALAAHDGFITSWALERDDGGEGRWAYRFDIDAEGHMHAVFIDALSARPLRAEPPPSPKAP